MADVEHAPGTGPGANEECVVERRLTYRYKTRARMEQDMARWGVEPNGFRRCGSVGPLITSYTKTPEGDWPIDNYDYTADINPGVDIAGILVAGCFIPWEAMNRG